MPADVRPGLTLSVSVDVLNALFDAAWRAGALSALARDPAFLRRVNARLAGIASFRLESVTLGLPPVATLSDAGLGLTVAEVELGLEDRDGQRRRLVAAGHSAVEATPRGDTLSLRLRATGAEGSCTTASGEGVTRWPCYPEVLRSLGDVLARRGALSVRLPDRLSAGPLRIVVQEVTTVENALHLHAALEP
ncbi:MAG: hypothetical protein D6729_18095 [Deltaproteobacteria bacterium]|nr:MAG: hypothetical protein D6729_18095 [Deltaproteobacteria bacterium]